MTDRVTLIGRADSADQFGDEILRVAAVELIYPIGHDRVTSLQGINVSVRTGQLVGLMGSRGPARQLS